MGCTKSRYKNKVYSNTVLPQETNKQNPQINNLTYHLKELEKEGQTKPTVSKWKEIITIRGEINKIEIKKK